MLPSGAVRTRAPLRPSPAACATLEPGDVPDVFLGRRLHLASGSFPLHWKQSEEPAGSTEKPKHQWKRRISVKAVHHGGEEVGSSRSLSMDNGQFLSPYWPVARTVVDRAGHVVHRLPYLAWRASPLDEKLVWSARTQHIASSAISMGIFHEPCC